MNMYYLSVNICTWRQRPYHNVCLMLRFVGYCKRRLSCWPPRRLSLCFNCPCLWSGGLPVGYPGVCDVWCLAGVEVSCHMPCGPTSLAIGIIPGDLD